MWQVLSWSLWNYTMVSWRPDNNWHNSLSHIILSVWIASGFLLALAWLLSHPFFLCWAVILQVKHSWLDTNISHTVTTIVILIGSFERLNWYSHWHVVIPRVTLGNAKNPITNPIFVMSFWSSLKTWFTRNYNQHNVSSIKLQICLMHILSSSDTLSLPTHAFLFSRSW